MFRLFATFCDKKGGAKKLSKRKFLWYIVRSGFAIAESELYFFEANVTSVSFVQREVSRLAVTEGLFFLKIFRLTPPLCHPERSESGVEPVGRCEASGSPLNL